LEYMHLLRCRLLLCGKPERQLAKPDVTNQLACKIMAKQVNTVGIRRPDSGGIFHGSPFNARMVLSLSIHHCSEDVLSVLNSCESMFVVWLSQARICSLS